MAIQTAQQWVAAHPDIVKKNPTAWQQYYQDYRSDPKNYDNYTDYKKAIAQINQTRTGSLADSSQDVKAVDQAAFSSAKNSGSGGGNSAQMDTINQNYQNLLNGGSAVNAQGQLSPTANVYETPQLDADGKPMKNAFVSIIDPATGMLRPQYQMGNALDKTSLNALRTEATRTGPSAWANLQVGAQRDALAKNSGAQSAQAMSNLAMQGGLSSGSGERIQNAAALGNLTGQQTIQRDIATQDETNRLGALQASTSADLASANYDNSVTKYNTGNSLNEILQKRAYDANSYGEAMKAYSAQQTANAAPSGGKK